MLLVSFITTGCRKSYKRNLLLQCVLTLLWPVQRNSLMNFTYLYNCITLYKYIVKVYSYVFIRSVSNSLPAHFLNIQAREKPPKSTIAEV